MKTAIQTPLMKFFLIKRKLLTNIIFFKVIIEKCQILEEEKSQLKAEFDNFKELAIATILDKDNEISNLKETHEVLLEVFISPNF